MTKSRGIRPPRRFWTDAEIAILRRDYPHMKTEKVAATLGRPVPAVYRHAYKLGLQKTAAYLASADAGRLQPGSEIGAAHRFAKGQVPLNKGLRRPGWHAGRMRETQFRKGERSGVAVKLYKPIGTERISKDGYLERKINDDFPAQRRWRFVHLIVWEANSGPVPPGHAVVFKAGRKSTKAEEITIDALELISREELMRRNSVHNLPKPLVEVVRLRSALKRQINRRMKDVQHNR